MQYSNLLIISIDIVLLNIYCNLSQCLLHFIKFPLQENIFVFSSGNNTPDFIKFRSQLLNLLCQVNSWWLRFYSVYLLFHLLVVAFHVSNIFFETVKKNTEGFRVWVELKILDFIFDVIEGCPHVGDIDIILLIHECWDISLLSDTVSFVKNWFHWYSLLIFARYYFIRR